MPRMSIHDLGIEYEYTKASGGQRQESVAKSGMPAQPAHETIVFLNGIAMTIGHWKPFVTAFSQRYACLCHDARGQLLSDKPQGPYSLAMHAKDLAALMDSLNIDKAHIIGTSYGSEIAMAFAIDYPARVASLVLIDGACEVDPLLGAGVEAWKSAALCAPDAFYKSIVPWTYSEEYIGANSATLQARGAAVAALPRDYFLAFAALCEAFASMDLKRHLPRLRCPTLVIVGDQDILKPVRCSKVIAQSIPGAALKIIPGAGHASVLEKPAEIIEEINDFLATVSR